MPVQYLEKFHERQRRFRFAILISGKRVDTASKYFRRLPLIQMEFFPDADNERRINNCGIHLLVESSINALVQADSPALRMASPHSGQFTPVSLCSK